MSKVLILGPVVTTKQSGGVAVFDEGLCNGFLNNGDDCKIISLEQSANIKNVCLNKKPSMVNFIFSFKKIAKIIKAEKPDLVICSLQYCLGIRTYKRKWPSAVYVNVLHGFPTRISGMNVFKKVLMSSRYTSKRFDKNVAVSHLSYWINNRVLGVKNDAVIPNGIDIENKYTDDKRDIDLIFTGRFVKAKNIEQTVNAFVNLKQLDPKLKIVVCGYGPLHEVVETKCKEGDIEYVGSVSRDEVYSYLRRSKFFISLNPLEPFGLVFLEALLCGCNVISQSTAGYLSYLKNKDYCHIADGITDSELTAQVKESLSNYHCISHEEHDLLYNAFSFDHIASLYKDLLN